MSMFFSMYHGFMSMLSSITMDLWACFHLSWIYEHVFIYHGFMSMFSYIMDLWACFHLSWIYEHVFFIYHGFMRMFSSIMDLWACFHLSFFIHSFTSSICICDKLYHKKKRKTFFMIISSFVILCQLLVHSFCTYHDLYHTIMSFSRCLQRAKFGGPSVWHSQRTQKQKQMYNDHIVFKLLKRPRLMSLNFLSQLSFWSKDVKTCTNFSSVSGDHLMRV
jgi:hypothetical protein